MALPSAAAPVQDGHPSGGTEYVEAVPAAAAPLLESLQKHEAAPTQETAVQDRPQAVQVQPIAQSLTGTPTADEHQQLQTSTAAPPQTSAASPAEVQTAGETQTEAKAATVPNTLDVICADVHGVLTLDFKSMRCFILHKGKSRLQPQRITRIDLYNEHHL